MVVFEELYLESQTYSVQTLEIKTCLNPIITIIPVLPDSLSFVHSEPDEIITLPGIDLPDFSINLT